jgi:putrescine aminotransferase
MNKELLGWEQCASLNINEVKQLYREYVNPGQAELIGTFGFGRTTAVSAEGVYITTADGDRILDFTGGVGVLNHGHNHPEILAARAKFQAQKRMEVHKNFLSQYLAGLSHNIGVLLPDDLKISYFCNSGAESVEGAVKLAYKYHQGNRESILAADISFHGKLLGSAGLTGSPEVHFKWPTIPNIHRFAYGDIQSVREAVKVIRKPSGESDLYALILEPMNASSLRECSTEFLKEVRELCTRENIVLIFDEVYTGWAKTGELFYFMKHGVVPDILTMSKSFGGGKASIAGFVTRRPVFQKAYGTLNDSILHSTTYNGFGEECVTAMEAIRILVENNFIQRSKEIGARLQPALKALQKKYPDFIADVRGSGSLNGVILNPEINTALRAAISFIPSELFKDPRFFDKLVTGAVISELFNEHKILTFYGSNKEIPLIIAPSLVVTDAELDRFVDALDKTLAQGRLKLVLKFAAYKFKKGGQAEKANDVEANRPLPGAN